VRHAPASTGDPVADSGWGALDLATAATLQPGAVLDRLEVLASGLSDAEARRRRDVVGRNTLLAHGVRPLSVLARQLRNPLLILLVAAALTSFFVGEGTDGTIIIAIMGLSIGLGFFNEYRAERAVEALHARLRHMALVRRDGDLRRVDVVDLVPGDVVSLSLGDVVPADVRLLEADGLECDEAVLTGEALGQDKQAGPIAARDSPLDLPPCAFMGTVVRGGAGTGVVVRTGGLTAFGAIALRLGDRQPETAFQRGLRDFSLLLVRVTTLLATSILVINIALGRSILESTLFALAIAVGLTPQLLPAIVTISLSSGAHNLARQSVVVKRLVSIEDLGNIEVLFTDKTGTLTTGEIAFAAALGLSGAADDGVLRAGVLCNEAKVADGRAIGGTLLDRALLDAAGAAAGADATRLAIRPFDHQRRLSSVLVAEAGAAPRVIVKGAPEIVLERCASPPPSAQRVLDEQFAAGARVVAVATRPVAAGRTALEDADERDLALAGFLVFSDPQKPGAAGALGQLARLEVEVKVITGDNDRVAEKVCRDLGLPVRGTLTGTQLEALDDAGLAAALAQTTIFARVTPEQKSRIIRAQRHAGRTVGFLGDGVNDAIALHDADVGISVDGATDVAKDAADIVLLEKELGILAGGVAEGRRIFANTMKYVLMGTSSNFGNMFSAGGASFFLSFLPMLPTQILLNNLLYDCSELTIPTDNVDPERLLRPAHWNTHFIRRFMLVFGPVSSLFDFITFGVMLWVFDAGPTLFRSGWFVESLATQSLVVFAIRTQRVPFLRSRPSRPLLISTLLVVAVGILIPYSPVAHTLGFTALPATFLAVLLAMVVVYLVLVDLVKRRFYRVPVTGPPVARPLSRRQRRIVHRASRWSTRRGARRRAAAGAA